MARKVKARTVTANLGRRRKYETRVLALIRAFHRMVIEDLLLFMDSQGVIAEDDSLSNPRDPKERRKLERLKRRIRAAIRANPERFRENVDSFIARNIPRWVEKGDAATRKVVDWYVRNCAYDISAAQRRAFMAAGMSEEVFREKWTMPTVGRYISAGAAETLPDLIEHNTGLITKMAVDDLARTREAVVNTVTGEGTLEDLYQVLQASKGFDDARAKRVVIDQTNKISLAVQNENAKSLDIKEAVWIHQPGQFTSRDWHIDMDGDTYEIAKGHWDKVVKRFIQPGELPFCRCSCRFVIPKKYMGVPD